MADLITDEECNIILRKALQSDKFTLSSFKITPFRKQGHGLIGEHYSLTVTYVHENQTNSQTFFLKNINQNNYVFFEISMEIMAYEKEAFFYDTLLPEYLKLNIDIGYAPKGYYFKPYITVLEDVGEEYSSVNKLTGMDLEHCKKALETLARFHSSTILYERKKGCLFEKNKDILSDKFQKKYVSSAIDALMQLIHVIEMDNKKKFIKKTQEFLALMEEEQEPVEGEIKTILHCDLWPNNFLFKYDMNGCITGCKLLDYQIIKYGAIQSDVVQFMMANTRKQLRDEFYSELIKFYYDCLAKFCETLDLDSETFLQSCQFFLLPAKILAIADRSLTFLSKEIWAEVLSDGEIFRKFIFEERGNYIVDVYKNDNDYRNILTEDVLELRDLVLNNIH